MLTTNLDNLNFYKISRVQQLNFSFCFVWFFRTKKQFQHFLLTVYLAVSSERTKCGLSCENGQCNLDQSGIPVCSCKDGYFYNIDTKQCKELSKSITTTTTTSDFQDGPLCYLPCDNGRCKFDRIIPTMELRPTCTCDEGYWQSGDQCIDGSAHGPIPSCDLTCKNGRCKFDFMGQPQCTCNENYTYSPETSTCEPSV